MNRKYNLIIIFTFIGTLAAFLLLSIVWPKQTILKEENRTANPFPTFNLDSIKNGNFSEGFESYYADQFPLRSLFMKVDKQVKMLISGNFVKSSDDVQVFYNKRDLGKGENLKDFDNLKNSSSNQDTQDSQDNTSLSSTASNSTPSDEPKNSDEQNKGSEITSQAEDQNSSIDESQTTSSTPENTEDTKPVELQRVDEDQVQNVGSVIMVGNRAMEIYYHNEDGILQYVQRLNDLADRLSSSQLYSVPAPTSVEFYASESYSSGANSQKASMDLIRDNLSDKVKYVDAYDSINNAAADPNNDLYLRTDHHWTQLGAYYAYVAFCKTAGLTPVALSEMEHGVIEGDSYGSMLSYTNNSQVLLDNPDHVEYWRPRHEVSGIAIDNENSIDESNGYEINLIEPKVWVDNKYIAFTAGDHSYLHYTSDVKNSKSVLLIKESYGNAFAPFLVSHYENVYILDPRRVSGVNLAQFCQDKNIDDVIVLNYAFAFTNPTWQSAFESMIY